MKQMQNVFFLILGLVFLLLGWQSLPDNNTTYGSYSKFWVFALTVFGGIVLGKWLSDYSTHRKK